MKKNCKNLTAKRLASRWQTTEKALNNMRFNGTGPAYIKLTDSKQGKVLYPLKLVKAYEAERTVKSCHEHNQKAKQRKLSKPRPSAGSGRNEAGRGNSDE